MCVYIELTMNKTMLETYPVFIDIAYLIFVCI